MRCAARSLLRHCLSLSSKLGYISLCQHDQDSCSGQSLDVFFQQDNWRGTASVARQKTCSSESLEGCPSHKHSKVIL